jgi:lipid II:glycine glycyltransferase (peptidoglycan interpeptide bridge formation enzyme)
MAIYRIDPLHDPRWDPFLQEHPLASVFHTRAWLQALRVTYGYEPVAFTNAAPGAALTSAVVFSQIRSFLTGSRLVSLPFADHCDPLVNSPDDLKKLLSHVEEALTAETCRYFELRCSGATDVGQSATLRRRAAFAHHVLDLRPNVESLFHGFHKSCIQRKVRRAERERLVYEEGESNELLQRFYRLLVLTRRRHGLPPQPIAWFLNLRDSFGSALKVRILSKEGEPIAGIVTVRYKRRLVYKYGASDARFHNLGAMPLLFWRTIQEGKALSLCEIDLGRSNWEDQGLITFKDHLGASSSTLNYYRYPANSAIPSSPRAGSLVPRLCTHLPLSLLRVIGSILYRHIG